MARKKEMCSSENHEPGAGIVLMKLEELHSFEGHPFKVERNQELFELRCSIEKEGVLVPLLVRKNPHGDGYEIIAGHRRKEAALWAGLTEVPVIIRELDDDQSVIAMVDSNLQREKILPSEKAFAYKMRLEAMKHQGRAEADTSDPLEPKCKTELVNVSELEAELQKLGKVKIQKKGGAEGKRSNEQLASMVGESVTQIKRYIRLTHLIPKILDMVDKEILAIRSAVEISFLSEEEQYEFHAVMELEQSIPNISQANRLKRMSQQKCLDMCKRRQRTSDSICAFIDESLVRAKGKRLKRSEVFHMYEEYCKENGRQGHGKSNFFRNMTDKGFLLKQYNGEFYYQDIAVKEEDFCPVDPEERIPFEETDIDYKQLQLNMNQGIKGI